MSFARIFIRQKNTCMSEKKLFPVSSKLTEDLNSFVHRYADMNDTSVSEIIYEHLLALQEQERIRYLNLKGLFDDRRGIPDDTE